MEVFVFVSGRTARQAVPEHVDDVDQVARARVVTDSLDDQRPPCSITEHVQPSIDRVVVAVIQVGKPKADRRLIQLGQNFIRPTHWLMSRLRQVGPVSLIPAHYGLGLTFLGPERWMMVS